MEGFMCYAEKNQKLKGNSENHTRTRDFYSAIKKNKLLMCAKPWLTLQSIRLNGRSQTPKVAYSMTPFI